ncbi:hypothetical protein CRI94_16275 [Longibacter salinarum]|uniref:Uncharacterized protein n=1 Tax=Longibacter salinarum TaxID=1850348 RepID=A0A2A8CUA9_9BACT|nr:hypothetical protein [Longibacter salinarum]PEN11340.1 hypothetical protein CRI94_16275 [Longibacter salinarum]
MACPSYAHSSRVDLYSTVRFALSLLVGGLIFLPGESYAQSERAEEQPAAVCIVNPLPPSPAFSGTSRSTAQQTWVCDPHSDLYTASVSSAPFGEQRIDGVAYTMVGLLGISGSVMLIVGGIFALRSNSPIDAIGVPMIVAGTFAGGAGIWSFVKGMRILFTHDQK